MEIRRLLTIVEDISDQTGRPASRVVTAAAIKNPLVEHYDEDLGKLLDLGGDVGKVLAERARAVVGDGQVLSVTKAALVGMDSVLEHAAALLHHKFGDSVSVLLGDVREVLPSKKAQGGPGTILSIPMAPAESAGSDLEIRVQGSPQPDEIVVALALNCADGPAIDEGDNPGDSSAGAAG